MTARFFLLLFMIGQAGSQNPADGVAPDLSQASLASVEKLVGIDVSGHDFEGFREQYSLLMVKKIDLESLVFDRHGGHHMKKRISRTYANGASSPLSIHTLEEQLPGPPSKEFVISISFRLPRKAGVVPGSKIGKTYFMSELPYGLRPRMTPEEVYSTLKEGPSHNYLNENRTGIVRYGFPHSEKSLEAEFLHGKLIRLELSNP